MRTMKTGFVLAIFVLNHTVFGQDIEPRTLTVQLTEGKEPIRGAILYIESSNPPRGAVTDVNGTATLSVMKQDKVIQITPFNPPIQLKMFPSADSIFYDIKKKRILYFKDGQRKGKLKLKG